MLQWLAASGAGWAMPALAQDGVAPRLSATTGLRVVVPGLHATQAFPLWCADRFSHLAQQGLLVRWSDEATDALALQKLQRGEADLAVVGLPSLLTGATDGPGPWRVLMQLWRSPQSVLLVSRRAVERYLAPTQLSGLRIGIGAPGAAASHTAWAVLHKGGVTTQAVNWVSLGAQEGALSALAHMQVDALVAQDPVVNLLERDFPVQIAADTRTLQGSRALFGGDYGGTCLVARTAWLGANPQPAQALVLALARALKWLQTAQTSDLAKVLPAQLGVGKQADHILAFEKARGALSVDGALRPDDLVATLAVMDRLQITPVEGDWRRALAPQWIEQARGQLAG
ncbi:ABC transporter substrate-binding protein [Comamonas serinivorans]|uniref:ABC transporter substrate-binding protein n=1 Tax=Comamonas serinivorans TaxID=1082851 RepID=UPI0012F83030|nr:ABC transporter substrate-binding protein [Comamonas serinivorans]